MAGRQKKKVVKKAEVKPDELTTQLEAAKATGKYMIGVWSVKDGGLLPKKWSMWYESL